MKITTTQEEFKAISVLMARLWNLDNTISRFESSDGGYINISVGSTDHISNGGAWMRIELTNLVKKERKLLLSKLEDLGVEIKQENAQ